LTLIQICEICGSIFIVDCAPKGHGHYPENRGEGQRLLTAFIVYDADKA